VVSVGANISQFVGLPRAKCDCHIYIAQNTDCGISDLDNRLCTTRVTGKAAHIGFSDMIFGRTGGINESNLCMTNSWGAPMVWPPCEGLPYFAVCRILLGHCKTLDNLLETLASIPVAWCTNFIISDPSGKAVLIEVAGCDRALKRIGPSSPEQFLYATNHFMQPQLLDCRAIVRQESVVRRETTKKRLTNTGQRVDLETKKTFSQNRIQRVSAYIIIALV
jgi:predicted choloylglycine hydrolase